MQSFDSSINQEMQYEEVYVGDTADGKLYCPICGRTTDASNFSRFQKSCRKRCNVELKKKTKFRKFSFQNSSNMSLKDWQEKINVSENMFSKKLLNETGVVLIKKFICKQEVNLLNGIVSVARNMKRKLVMQTISGGMKMINVPCHRFTKSDEDFAFACDFFVELTSRIQDLIGDNYQIVGDISIIQTPKGCSNQFIHADNILKSRYNGLLVLSNEAPPTEFFPKKEDDVGIFESPTLNMNGEIDNQVEKMAFRKKFQVMWEPIRELENQMKPVSQLPMEYGDLVLFEADMLHRGVGSKENKTLMFFQAVPKIEEESVQFHMGLIGGYFYGNNPSDIQKKEEYFNLLKMHNDSVSKPPVPLQNLLAEEPKISYLNWLKTKPPKTSMNL
jgi:hypothetical protein